MDAPLPVIRQVSWAIKNSCVITSNAIRFVRSLVRRTQPQSRNIRVQVQQIVDRVLKLYVTETEAGSSASREQHTQALLIYFTPLCRRARHQVIECYSKHLGIEQSRSMSLL